MGWGGPGASAPSPEALAGWALMEGPGAGTGQATTPGSVKLGTLRPLQARVPPAAAGGTAEEPLVLPSAPHVETPARALVVLPPRPGDLWNIPDLVIPRSVYPSAPSVLAVHPDPTQRPNTRADPQRIPCYLGWGLLGRWIENTSEDRVSSGILYPSAWSMLCGPRVAPPVCSHAEAPPRGTRALTEATWFQTDGSCWAWPPLGSCLS